MLLFCNLMLLFGACIPPWRHRCSKRRTQTLSPYPSSATSRGILPMNPDTCLGSNQHQWEASSQAVPEGRGCLLLSLRLPLAAEHGHGGSLALCFGWRSFLPTVRIIFNQLQSKAPVNLLLDLYSLRRTLLWIISAFLLVWRYGASLHSWLHWQPRRVHQLLNQMEISVFCTNLTRFHSGVLNILEIILLLLLHL